MGLIGSLVVCGGMKEGIMYGVLLCETKDDLPNDHRSIGCILCANELVYTRNYMKIRDANYAL